MNPDSSNLHASLERAPSLELLGVISARQLIISRRFRKLATDPLFQQFSPSPPLVKLVLLQANPTCFLANIEILEYTKRLLATLTILNSVLSVQLE